MTISNQLANRQNFEQLIQAIIGIVGEYRIDDFKLFDAKHIQRWLEQFTVAEKERIVILSEIRNLLQAFFISRERAKNCLRKFFQTAKDDFPGQDIRNITFIKNQPPGKSQFDLLLLVDEILSEDYGFTTVNCGSKDHFLYIDDVIYSGNKFRYDIQNWIAMAPNKLNLISYHIAWHLAGSNYATRHVGATVAGKCGTLKSWRTYDLCDDRRGNAPLNILWPKYFPGSSLIDNYANVVHQQLAARNIAGYGIFRDDGMKFANGIFSSETNQNVLEQVFLSVGAKLCLLAQNPQPSVRPMGVEFLSTLGFGSPIVTYRNIANNCPLALWYGDPEYQGTSHPFGQWYPLFKRKN